MSADLGSAIRPVAPPQIIDGAYTDDQHGRLVELIRREGPWPLILAQTFKSPEEVLATTSGTVPEGVKLTWDMFLSPVFRTYLARGGTCLYPEIEDLFLNRKFLDLVRGYWKADYARPAGRGGPGAGRPAKRYRRADREVAVSLPQREYDLAGSLLASAPHSAGPDRLPISWLEL